METILSIQASLSAHPVYLTLKDLDGLRHFMRYHVFAVWDFMSLLKSLQKEITCTNVPWRPSDYPSEMVRLINQIVLGEESDLDQHGNPTSHFDLYLKSMEEVGASTSEIRDFLNGRSLECIPLGAREFVSHNLDVAMHGDVVEVAANFFFGREKLIPSMFTSIVEILNREKIEAPTLLYYLERHIEVDGEEHGPLALKCLNHLTKQDPELIDKAIKAGIKSLELRTALWDKVLCGSSNI
ncbi:MAG TPA: DUF3050 domain-containing protein [Bacteriovoracaceae bacterium]|nr:DUF3050 domain-containing protein [Bacteriovoracaceae bacterium]